MMKKKINISYFFTTVFLFFIIIMFLVDIIVMKSFGYVFLKQHVCYDKIVIYNYCKNSENSYYFAKDDLVNKKVKININKNKFQYTKNIKPSEIDQADIVIIGDSFVQAKAVNIEKRMDNYFRQDGLKVTSFGFGSWSPVQYKRIIENYKFKKNAKILIFLMTNDFTPSYRYSSVNFAKNLDYYKNFYLKGDELKSNFYYKLKSILLEYSYIFNFLKKSKNNFKRNTVKNNYIKVDDIFSSSNYKDCSLLSKYSNKIHEELLDYLYFSKQSDCWNNVHTESVNYTLNEIKKINELTKGKHEVFLFLIPAGWTLPDENLGGKNTKLYKMSKDTTITSYGLSEYLKKDLDNFYDLEPVLKEIKKKYSSNNKLFLSFDSHWTELAHREIYEYLKTIF
jgi:hypothetical protein